MPGYLKQGPARCRVCSTPVFRGKLCQRHYTAVRNGKTELYVERQRPFKRLVPAVQIHPYLAKPVYEAAVALAKDAKQSLNRWLTDLIAAEAKRKSGKDPRPAQPVFPDEVDEK